LPSEFATAATAALAAAPAPAAAAAAAPKSSLALGPALWNRGVKGMAAAMAKAAAAKVTVVAKRAPARREAAEEGNEAAAAAEEGGSPPVVVEDEGALLASASQPGSDSGGSGFAAARTVAVNQEGHQAARRLKAGIEWAKREQADARRRQAEERKRAAERERADELALQREERAAQEAARERKRASERWRQLEKADERRRMLAAERDREERGRALPAEALSRAYPEALQLGDDAGFLRAFGRAWAAAHEAEWMRHRIKQQQVLELWDEEAQLEAITEQLPWFCTGNSGQRDQIVTRAQGCLAHLRQQAAELVGSAEPPPPGAAEEGGAGGAGGAGAGAAADAEKAFARLVLGDAQGRLFVTGEKEALQEARGRKLAAQAAGAAGAATGAATTVVPSSVPSSSSSSSPSSGPRAPSTPPPPCAPCTPFCTAGQRPLSLQEVADPRGKLGMALPAAMRARAEARFAPERAALAAAEARLAEAEAAVSQAVRQRHRRLALQLHPDKLKRARTSADEEAFQLLGEASEVLGVVGRRRAYIAAAGHGVYAKARRAEREAEERAERAAEEEQEGRARAEAEGQERRRLER
jgi:hypothetical protein